MLLPRTYETCVILNAFCVNKPFLNLMRLAVDPEYSGNFDTESNGRKVESEKCYVLGMVFSWAFKLFQQRKAFLRHLKWTLTRHLRLLFYLLDKIYLNFLWENVLIPCLLCSIDPYPAQLVLPVALLARGQSWHRGTARRGTKEINVNIINLPDQAVHEAIYLGLLSYVNK